MSKLTKELLHDLILEALLEERTKPSTPQEYLDANKSLGGTLSVPRIKFNNIVATEGAKTGFITKATQALGTSNDIDGAIDKICNFFNKIITKPINPATQEDVTDLINNTALAQGLFMATQDYEGPSLGFIMESYFAAIIQGTVAGSNQQAEDLYKVVGNKVYFYSSKFLTVPSLNPPDKLNIGGKTSKQIKLILSPDKDNNKYYKTKSDEKVLDLEPYKGKQVGMRKKERTIRYIVGLKDDADNPTELAFYYYDFPAEAFSSTGGLKKTKALDEAAKFINSLDISAKNLQLFNTNFEKSVNNFANGLGNYYKSINNFKILMNSYLIDWSATAANGAKTEFDNLKNATNAGLGQVGKKIAEQKINEKINFDIDYGKFLNRAADQDMSPFDNPRSREEHPSYKYDNLRINLFGKDRATKNTDIGGGVEYKDTKSDDKLYGLTSLSNLLKLAKADGKDAVLSDDDIFQAYMQGGDIEKIASAILMNTHDPEVVKDINTLRTQAAKITDAGSDAQSALSSQKSNLPSFAQLSRAVNLQANKKAKEILEANKNLGAGESVPDFQLTQAITKQGNADLFWVTLGEKLNAKNNIIEALTEICRTANGLQFGEFEFKATATKDKITELLSRMILLQSFIKAVRTTQHSISGFTQENWLAILIQGLVQGSNQQAEDIIHKQGNVTTYYSAKLYDKIGRYVPLGKKTYNAFKLKKKPITYVFGYRDNASNPTKIEFYQGTYDFKTKVPQHKAGEGGGLLFEEGNFTKIPDGVIQITDTSIDSMIQTFGALTNELSIDLNALYKSMNNFQIFMNGYFQEWDVNLADAAIQEFGAMKKAINQALAVGGQVTITENKFKELDLMIEHMVKYLLIGEKYD